MSTHPDIWTQLDTRCSGHQLFLYTVPAQGFDNHRITECLKLEGTPGGHLLQLPFLSRAT